MAFNLRKSIPKTQPISEQEEEQLATKKKEFDDSIISYQDILDEDIDTSGIELLHLNQYFDSSIIRDVLRPIVGNEEVRIIVSLLWLIAKRHVLIRGESGSAKSEIMKAIVSLVWGDLGLDGQEEELYMMDKTSEKGPLNSVQAAKIEIANYCFIPELQNALNQEWILKKWAEGEPANYNRNIKGGQDTEEILLNPLPVLSNLADFNEVLKELTIEWRRRFVSLYTLSSEQINGAVQMNKAQVRFKRRSSLMSMDKSTFDALRAKIKKAMNFDGRVVNPFAMTIQSVIPKKYTDSNTFIDYWFDLIETITVFYMDKRYQVWDDEDQEFKIFSTLSDNMMVIDIAGPIFMNLCLGIPDLGIHILEMFPKLEYDSMDSGRFGDLDFDTTGIDGKGKGKKRAHKPKDDRFKSPEEIQDLLDKMGFPRKMEWVTATLEHLVVGGFLRKTQKGTAYFRTRDMMLEQMIEDWSAVWESAVDGMNKEYPEYIGPWIVTNKPTYIHPINGEKVTIGLDETDLVFTEDTNFKEPHTHTFNYENIDDEIRDKDEKEIDSDIAGVVSEEEGTWKGEDDL